MDKKPDLTDRALSFVLKAIRFEVAAVLAVVLYAAGFALPLATHAPLWMLVLDAIAGSLLAFVVIFGWVVVRLADVERRHLVNWTSSIRLLDSREFEWFVGEIFRREGFAVEQTGRSGEPDGNVDLVLTKGRKRFVVQCKRWQSWDVGVDEIRRFAGTLMREGLPGQQGIFVTLSEFTKQATDEARKMGICLLTGAELEQRWNNVRQVEPCPECGETMFVAKSRFGWWLQCRATGCGGKRDLDRNAGRAIELLTSS